MVQKPFSPPPEKGSYPPHCGAYITPCIKKESNMDTYQEFITLKNYSRYLWDEKRREIWPEIGERYCNFMFQNPLIPNKVKIKSKEKILNLDVMPSMRALATAGAAAEYANETIYNCSFLAIDSPSAFGEALWLLMCGCGVGFSVEQRHISKLPVVKYSKNLPPLRFKIPDSRLGWKQALDLAIECLYEGKNVFFDFSEIRPMGTPLKTMGGRSSGPDVLRDLLNYVKEVFNCAQGRRLTASECHCILCAIASVIMAGGTRRSALLSMSDLTDQAMRSLKTPPYNPILHYANNSAAYYEHPDILDFLDEWVNLAKSGQGERGIVNIYAARRNAPHRRKSKLIEGTNPCGEVPLRNKGLCNLTEVIIRASDDFETLRDKITTATWLGVIQSTFSNFKEISPKWRENAEEERLIGVSLTGQQDAPSLLTPEVLRLSKAHVINVARKAAKILGINMPAACTTTKPSGTVSQLTNSAPGLHPRWSQYYVRSVMLSRTDPLLRLLQDQKAPTRLVNSNDAIVSFPVAAPDGCITRKDMSALDQLNWYKRIAENWTELNPSCTIYVGHDEWLKVAAWVYDNFNLINGVSFFPKNENEHTYEWLPFQEITREEYLRLRDEFPQIDFSKLPDYEGTDMTDCSRELACAGGNCEI